jgi:alpha-tubulin suppressor-like RCC1 family protein
MKLKIVPFLLSFALSSFAQSTNASVNVRAWGDNTYGQTNVPPDLTNAVAVSAGDYHCLALRTDGSVVAWGYGGDGRTTIPANATNVVAISAGAYHSLALRADGTVLGWGDNSFYGQATGVPGGPPGIVTNGGQILSNVVAIAAGSYCSLALKADGTIVEWGAVNVTNIQAVTNVVAITTYSEHAFAVKADRTVLSWGTRGGAISVQQNATNVVAISTSTM